MIEIANYGGIADKKGFKSNWSGSGVDIDVVLDFVNGDGIYSSWELWA